jgi:hypothetical protein
MGVWFQAFQEFSKGGLVLSAFSLVQIFGRLW